MKKEFENRIGLVITDEEYAGIEAAYTDSVDKDKFVKIWLHEGGIQDLFGRRLVEVKRRDGEIGRLKKETELLLDIVDKRGAAYVRLRDRAIHLDELLEEIVKTLDKLTA